MRDQFRQQHEALNAAELEADHSERLARETQQRGDDSALNAAQAMEDLARIDPVGPARQFGHQAGDRLKSPEEMRREWAELMRGGCRPHRRPRRDGRQWKRVPQIQRRRGRGMRLLLLRRRFIRTRRAALR